MNRFLLFFIFFSLLFPQGLSRAEILLNRADQLIEQKPNNPSGYLNYLSVLNVVLDEKDGDWDDYSKIYDEKINQGFYNIFEGVTVERVQQNPEYYSPHIRFAKLFEYSKEVPEEQSFEYLLDKILTFDRINNILMADNNNQLYIDYHQNLGIDKINDIFEYLMVGYKDVIIYQLEHDGVEYLDRIDIYILKMNEEDNDFYRVDIYEYFADMSGNLYDNTGALLHEGNEEIESFFYDDDYNLLFEERIKLFEDALSDNIEPAMYKPARMFYDVLIDGIKNLHEDFSEDLLIIPDPSISNIPFEFLTDNEDNLLMYHHNITYSNSLYQYYEDMKRYDSKWTENNSLTDEQADKKLANWNPNIVVFGEVRYNAVDQSPLLEMGFTKLRNLRWSNKELDSIQNQFQDKKRTIYREKLATETMVKNLDFDTVDFLHFSTHGISLYDNHKKSSLILQNDNINDGFLTYEEVLKLDLSNLEFVFLSACDTNKGENFRNINLLSLQKAFKDAGARNVLSTLWEIDDKATSVFSGIYYEMLMIDPLYPDLALTEAKIKFIERYPEYDSPHYWAAFVNYGY